MEHYATLKMIHLTALAMTFMGLSGILAAKATGKLEFNKRLLFHLLHGIGLLGLLATGIAMAAVAGMGNPGWLKAKFVIWLLAGGAMVLAVRFSRLTGPVLLFFVLLVFTAAWLALDKPF